MSSKIPAFMNFANKFDHDPIDLDDSFDFEDEINLQAEADTLAYAYKLEPIHLHRLNITDPEACLGLAISEPMMHRVMEDDWD